jgi:hypothetical protein
MRRGTLLEKDRILDELDAWKPGTGESDIVSFEAPRGGTKSYRSNQDRKASGC